MNRGGFSVLFVFVLLCSLTCVTAIEDISASAVAAITEGFDLSDEKMIFEQYSTTLSAGSEGDMFFGVQGSSDDPPNCVSRLDIRKASCKGKVQVSGQKEEDIRISGYVHRSVAYDDIGFGKLHIKTARKTTPGTYMCSLEMGKYELNKQCQKGPLNTYQQQNFFVKIEKAQFSWKYAIYDVFAYMIPHLSPL